MEEAARRLASTGQCVLTAPALSGIGKHLAALVERLGVMVEVTEHPERPGLFLLVTRTLGGD